jgi:hypothetical protein
MRGASSSRSFDDLVGAGKQAIRHETHLSFRIVAALSRRLR